MFEDLNRFAVKGKESVPLWRRRLVVGGAKRPLSGKVVCDLPHGTGSEFRVVSAGREGQTGNRPVGRRRDLSRRRARGPKTAREANEIDKEKCSGFGHLDFCPLLLKT